MRWDESVRCVLPATGDRVISKVRRRWSGVRIYITMRTARLEWQAPATGPSKAAERFAADLDGAVRAAGGNESHTRAILLPLAGAKHDIY